MFPLTVDRIIETSVQLFRALAPSPHPGPEDLSSKHQASVWHLLSAVLTLHISYRAAEFYYQNKFPAYTECSQPCQAMEVEAKFKTKSETCNSQITFMFPRDVQKTEEFYSTTPLSLGRTFQFK